MSAQKQTGDKRLKKNTTPITKCFTPSKKHSITSPEYTMTRDRETRSSSSKSKSEEQQCDNSKTGKGNKSENEAVEVHSAVSPCPTEIEQEGFKALSHDQQMECIVDMLNALCRKVTEIDVTINHDTDGLSTQISTAQSVIDQATAAGNELKTSLASTSAKIEQEAEKDRERVYVMADQNQTIKGIMSKFNNQLHFLNEKVAMLTAKSMENNITISGIYPDPDIDPKKEDCKQAVITFLREVVEIDVGEDEIFTAYRIGKPAKRAEENGKRNILTRCKPELKERIFANIKNLKDKTNEKNEKYYINKQLPELYIERNKQVRETIRAIKSKEKDLHVNDRTEIEVKNRTVYLDGKPAPEHLPKVEIEEMFPGREERNKQDKIKLYASDPESKDNSTFMAYATKCAQMPEVKRAYRKVKRMHPNADHVVAAYKINKYSGYQDDDEIGVGSKLLQTLEEENNIAVFVVRLHGRINLGPDRFDIIKKVGSAAVSKT